MGSNLEKDLVINKDLMSMNPNIKDKKLLNESSTIQQEASIVQQKTTGKYDDKEIDSWTPIIKRSHVTYRRSYIPEWIDEKEVMYWNCKLLDYLPSDEDAVENMNYLLDYVELTIGFEKKLSITLLLFDYILEDIYTIKNFTEFRRVARKKLLDLIIKHHTIRSFENVYRLIFKDKDDLSELNNALKQRDEQKRDEELKLLVKYEELKTTGKYDELNDKELDSLLNVDVSPCRKRYFPGDWDEPLQECGLRSIF